MQTVGSAWWLIMSFGVPFVLGLSAQPLLVRLDGDNLRISAPQLEFLTGKPLARLKDGAAVGFLGQLTLSVDANKTIEARAIARFAMSYDIWEERFTVTQIENSLHTTARRTLSHLNAQAAQAWCLESLSLDLSRVPLDKTFWVRLEFRAEDPRESAGVIGEPGINLTRLIEIFSRPASAKSPTWTLDSGPLRLADLKHAEPRRTG